MSSTVPKAAVFSSGNGIVTTIPRAFILKNESAGKASEKPEISPKTERKKKL